jgi:hypothetical protein
MGAMQGLTLRISRLEASIVVSMVGWLADWSITRWMLNDLTGFYESNTNLLPQVGIPLIVLNFILADRILPRKATYDRVIFTMALLQWSGFVQNVLVLCNIIRGLDYFTSIIPLMGGTYLLLHFGSILGDRLRLASQQWLN